MSRLAGHMGIGPYELYLKYHLRLKKQKRRGIYYVRR